MQFYTYYSQDGTTYISNAPRNMSDIAIPDKPADMPRAKFNPERREWERVYEEAEADDIDIGDAERLWALAGQTEDRDKQLMARMVMKLAAL